ncbi:MAG: site-specific DNA-methyltransferase [Firmicutes bacterium]|nr:site-specific DNA-methyltransferase [Bacillota bacterium]
MEKMKMETPDITARNIEKIAEMFPNCITEDIGGDGKPRKAINFEILRQMLSDEVIEGDEAYEFTWVGKKAAMVEANKPIRKTLRPCKEESVDWDNTENLYIEGDNLQVLKLLQESYMGKVKMIYIDPPYNTGNDFVYRDDFKQSKEEYEEEQGVYDDESNRLFKNTDTNGRFHSDWCSMIYSRLLLARNLLADDGVIFVSIDNNEVQNLTSICNEIYGEKNQIGLIIVKSNPRGSMSTEELASLHEYLLVFCKNRQAINIIGHALSEDMNNEYKYEDSIGNYRLLGLRMRGGFWRRSDRPNLYFPIYINPNNGEVSIEKNEEYSDYAIPVQPSTMEDGTWRWSKEKISEMSGVLIAKKIKRNDEYVWDVFQKDYYEREGGRRTKAKSIWEESEINYQNGTSEIKKLLGSTSFFDYSKPTYLIYHAMEMIQMNDNDIVLDFFSGSATTAHAVMQLNAEDGGNRKFIMVQIPEETDEKSEAYKAGYKNICEIGKERIRRAAKKIAEENSDAKFDGGFRVFKLDDTNMKDVYYGAGEYSQLTIDQFVSNIKEDRTDMDLLFGCLLDWGVTISQKHSMEEIDGCHVHTYGNGAITDLMACFDENIPESVIKYIAKKEPMRVVFRDSSFADSPAKINVTEIFKMLSPDTEVKVI